MFDPVQGTIESASNKHSTRISISMYGVEHMSRRSFIQRLRDAAHSVQESEREDPWTPTLRKVKGKVGHDGVERISTADALDILGVPMRARPALTVRLSTVMRQLGWSNIRARGLNPGSYRDRVRGYAREVPGHPATARLPNEF
jgi:hypothetical protein